MYYIYITVHIIKYDLWTRQINISHIPSLGWCNMTLCLSEYIYCFCRRKREGWQRTIKRSFWNESGNINMGDLLSILLLPKKFGHLYTWTTGTDTMTRGSRYSSKGHQTIVWWTLASSLHIPVFISISRINFEPSQHLMSHKVSHCFLAFFWILIQR